MCSGDKRTPVPGDAQGHLFLSQWVILNVAESHNERQRMVMGQKHLGEGLSTFFSESLFLALCALVCQVCNLETVVMVMK